MGSPLKTFFSPPLVRRLAADIQRVDPSFSSSEFVRQATSGLRRWRWRSGDEAETDLFSETEGGSTEVVVRAKPTWEEREKAYADVFHWARLPALIGRYAGADGTVVEVDGKGLARVGGHRVEARIVECVSEDRPEYGQTGCLVLAPKGDVGQAGEWLIRPEGRALTLVQGLQAFETRNGVWPGGFELVDGGQVLKRTR